MGFTSIALGILGYAYMYAMFLGEPSNSWPGKYLCASIPFQAIVITAFCFEHLNKGKWKRYLYFCLTVPGIFFMVSIAVKPVAPLEVVPLSYLKLFIPYWSPTRISYFFDLPMPNKPIALKAANGKYVTVGNQAKELLAEGDSITDSEIFKLIILVSCLNR